jgi:hypothetical protein
MEKVEKTVEEMATEITNKIKAVEENSATKEVVEKLNKDIEDLVGKYNALLVEKSKTKTNTIKAQFDKINDGFAKELPKHTEGYQIKADTAFNLFAIAGAPFANDEANLDASILAVTARQLGVSQIQSSQLNLLAEILRFAQPIEMGEALQIFVPYDENGKPLKVQELKTKPRATVKWKAQKVEASKIAVEWVNSREFQKRTETIRQFQAEYFNILMTEELQIHLFTDVLALGQNFVANPALLFTDPGKYDVLLALAATIKDNKYNPTHVVINALDNASMFGEKGLDGQYRLANGQSIQLINGGTQLVVGGHVMTIIVVDSTILAPGEVAMFDISKFKIGAGTTVEYNVNPYEFFSQNAVVNQLEIAFAVMLPENHEDAIIVDKFEDVLPLITAPEPNGGE